MATPAPGSRDGRLRVAIVDADHRVRDSLGALIDSAAELEMVGAAGHPAAALDLVNAQAPDVVILDPRLPEVDAGLGLISRLRTLRPSLGLLVMSWHDGLETECLELGADGFVRKSGGPNELIEAIVAAGNRPVSGNPSRSPAADVARTEERSGS